jgi:superfamily II DNA or RNA helicase
MLAKIIDNYFIYLGQVTHDVEQCLTDHFSVRDPRSYRMREGPWDGWYRRYNVKHQRLALPFLNELKICCEANDIPLEIVDERDAPTFPAPQSEQITENLITGIKLEQYQVRCLQACCHDEIGVVSAKTGAGKGEMICGLVKMFRCPTLVITEQIVVLEQLVERLYLRDVVHNNDIGMFCHGHMPDGNLVIVGSIQSINSPSKPDIELVKVSPKQAIAQAYEWAKTKHENLNMIFQEELVQALHAQPNGVVNLTGKYLQILITLCEKLEWERIKRAYLTRFEHAKKIQAEAIKCDLLLVDEADLCTSTNYSKLFRKYFNGRRRYGFTGTPTDPKKPVQNLFLKENLGNIIVEVRKDEVEGCNRIIPVKIVFIAVGEDGDKEDCRTYDIAIREEMVENTTFHALIANIVASFPNDGTLILVDTSPIEPLGRAIEELIPNSKFIYGGTPKTERRKYIQSFEKREFTCLIGSKILKRGLDLEGGVDNLIIIGGGSKWSEFEQKVGRAVRLNKRGWARVFDFFFLNNKYLYKHSREILKAAVNMGYETRVVVSGAEIDGKKFIKSRFHIPKT